MNDKELHIRPHYDFPRIKLYMIAPMRYHAAVTWAKWRVIRGYHSQAIIAPITSAATPTKAATPSLFEAAPLDEVALVAAADDDAEELLPELDVESVR